MLNTYTHRDSIIGLTGLPGAGKDTVADFMVAAYGYVKMAFADPLKGEIAKAFNIDVALFYDVQAKQYVTPRLAIDKCHDSDFFEWFETNHPHTPNYLRIPRSPRWWMQTWGTEYRRGQDSRYWIKRMEALIHAHPDAQRIVVSDVRFPNEAMLLSNIADKFDIWHLIRPDGGYHATTHASDTPIQSSLLNDTIVNDGSVEMLHVYVSRLIRDHFKKGGTKC